jgi:uncharacterized membrane protein
MTDRPASPADDTVFAATIQPHRSLGDGRRRMVIVLVAVAAALSSVPFWLVGAWPVIGYFGLDVLLLWLAFRINTRRARAFEEVVLTHVELCLRKVTHRGETREWRFSPAWVRVERREDEEFGLLGLSVVSGRTRVPLAAALSPAERADFARALDAGLMQARRGPRFG